MLKRIIAFSFLFFAIAISANRILIVRSQNAGAVINNNFPSAHDMPPPNWTGPVFALSQDYPASMPTENTQPWKQFNPRTQPVDYLNAVLKYGYEGNVAVDFVLQKNEVRKWYHAPWLHSGNNGREFIHGMTKERMSRPKELAPTQTKSWQNWAVGFYNAPGGFVIGQVWKNKTAPNPTAADFPDGTVAMKLLFTQAPVSQVPYLNGSFEWLTDIHRTTETGKAPEKLRLLQIDIAVRDREIQPTGWVFGTFIYNADAPGTNPLDKMVPVGLMVGNDPQALSTNGPLTETFINPLAHTPHLGYKGRLNGPVDNPVSSCMSCHSTAQIPFPFSQNLPTRSGVPPQNPSPAVLDLYFRNIPAGQPFDAGYTALDYSLQLQVGIANFLRSTPQPAPGPVAAVGGMEKKKTLKLKNILPIERDGKPKKKGLKK